MRDRYSELVVRSPDETLSEFMKHELELTLNKVAIMLTREEVSRAGAIAAIDHYLWRNKIYHQRGDDPMIPEETHITEIGIDQRLADILEDHLGLWSVADLTKATVNDIITTPGIGPEYLLVIQERLGAVHLSLRSDDVTSSSEEEPSLVSPEEGTFAPELAPMDQLLSRWLGAPAT